MSKIPEIPLPSNPSIKISLREATVEEAIDFADINEGLEEAVTTLFLNTVQDKASFVDSKTWTGEDRRFMLFWHWLHTTDDTDLPITYPCPLCGEEHTVLLKGQLLAEGYKDMKGFPERDIEWEGHKIIVKPLNGADLEELELVRLERMNEAIKSGLGSGRVRVIDARMKVLKFLLNIRFADEPEEKGREERKKRIMALSSSKFKSLSHEVAEKLTEMRHGLLTEYEKGKIFILSPKLSCPTAPDREGVRVQVPFRNSEYVPRV